MHKKKPCGAGLRPSRTISLEEHRVGGTEISGLILSPSCCSLSLLLCLKIACFLKLGAAPEELSAFNIWPSLNIEPTLSQISEETLESLKLREKNFECQTAPSSQQPTKGMSRNDAWDSLKPHRSSQLKQVSNRISIKWLNRVVFISKVKTLEFSS